MSQWSFVNDQFVPEEKALVPVRDLSVQRGYGVFDFFKVVHSVPVFLEEHLDRFYFSAAKMRLKVGYSKEELKQIVFGLLQKNAVHDMGVRITLTGGCSPDGYQLSNSSLILTLHSFPPPTQEQFEKGVTLISYEHQRQLPEVKSIDYLMAIWLQPFIRQNNADEVLYHQNGMVRECPRSNFFMVTKENKIVTPASRVLKGVMRSKLIEIAGKFFEVEEREITIGEIKTAKEAFITSTTKTVLPIYRIDQHVFSRQNEVTAKLFQSLLQMEAPPTQTT